MAAKQKMLEDAFLDTLKDVYYAEKQAVRALGKQAKAAQASELKDAFEKHREETSGQVERLEQVFEIIGKPARTKTCEAMQGLVHEMQEDMEDYSGSPAADAILIACAQAVEHYEISRYGTLATWAKKLGHADAAKLLGATLEEEKRTDELLTQIAESVNTDAGGEGEEAMTAGEPTTGGSAKRSRGKKAA